MKICSLVACATDILLALGLRKNLVGISYDCKVSGKPVVVDSIFDSSKMTSAEIDKTVKETYKNGGTIFSLDIDKINKLKPDIVFTQELCYVCALTPSQLKNYNFFRDAKIETIDPKNLTDLFKVILQVAEKTGTGTRGIKLVKKLKNELDSVKLVTKNSKTVTTACIEWLDPLFSAGHWIPEMVQTAGGKNLIGKRGAKSAEFHKSELLNKQPEYIIITPCGFSLEQAVQEYRKLVKSQPWWEKLKAFKNKTIFAVDSEYFVKPGPKVIDGVNILARIFHPEKFDSKFDRLFVQL
ncbi:MAG: ABC transporter substrate-binding protein [Planctomycetes bacterium]|nr:ABC transporter substrate-binding protein [Planctomycetota bacterium]